MVVVVIADVQGVVDAVEVVINTTFSFLFSILAVDTNHMFPRHPQIDQIILNALPFAQPILIHFRELVHVVCPEVEEKIKWGMPHFDYKGQMMCHMASFKHHCAFSFYKAELIDEQLVKNAKTAGVMGHLGKITSLKDLPSDAQLKKWIKAAMQLNDKGITITKPKVSAVTIPPAPDYLKKLFAKDPIAKKAWTALRPSHQKEYIQWLTDAKTEATREKRLNKRLDLLEEGKSLNWKYN